jgi:outer membrane protein
MNKKEMIITARAACICALAPLGLLAAEMDKAAPSHDSSYDMSGAVKRALAANPQMTAIRHAYLGAEEGRRSARGDFGPEFRTTYGYENIHRGASFPGQPVADDVWTWTFNIRQDLFTGFRILSTYEKAVLSKEQTAARILQTELSLIQSVQENFLNLLKARADVKIARDQVARLEEQLKVNQSFYDVGLKPKLDVLQAVARLSQAENELLQAENDVDTRTARLNTLLSVPIETDIEYLGQLEYMPFSLDFQECLERAYDNRPDLLIAKKSVMIAHKDKTITESEFWPQIGADFNWSTQGDDWTAGGSFEQPNNFSQWSVGVSANWKFFESGKVYYASRQAAERINELEAEALNTRQEAAFEVKSNRLNISEAAERIEVARDALAEAKESYRMALERYRAQVGTNIDVLDAQAQLTRAQGDLSQALADYEIALANLYVAMGIKNPGLTTQ